MIKSNFRVLMSIDSLVLLGFLAIEEFKRPKITNYLDTRDEAV